LAPKGAALERYVVRFGETLDQVALARKTTRAKLVELNGIGADEMIRGGTVLLVPTIAGGSATTKEPFAPPITTAAGSLDGKPVVLIPGVPFHYRDRDRVFYRVLVGDTPRAIADAFSVTLDDLSRWNALDLGARLQDGMALQLFVKKGVDLSRVLAMREPEVRVLAVGSDDFYTYEEAQKGRKRVTVTAKKGDTLEGDAVIVYVPLAKGEKPVVSGKGDDKKIDEPKAATNPEDSKPGKAKADDAKADDAKADERALDAALSEAKSPEITAPATIEPTAPPAASTAPETSPTSGAAK
jgi:membrane-bound lytic murein transglycosylase D